VIDSTCIGVLKLEVINGDEALWGSMDGLGNLIEDKGRGEAARKAHWR